MSTVNLPTTVDEIRTELLKAGDDPATVASMKKAELRDRLIKITTEKIDFDLESLQSETSPAETLEGAIGVTYGSPAWHSYIMGLFNPDELMDGYPKVNGLARVAGLVLGDIISSKATQVFVTHGEARAVTVNYEVQIEWKLNTPVGFGNMGHSPQIRVFGGLSCCTEDLSNVFGRHPSAVAESKAFGRALRKALSLNIIAAEEMLSSEDSSPKAKASASITKPLQDVIKAKSDALDLNLKEVITKWVGGAKELSMFTVQEGRDFFEHLNTFQQTKKI